MKQESLFKKLGLILNELNEQYQFLAQNPQQLNELELELFHANANFLADHIQIIKKLTENKAPLSLPTTPTEIVEIEQPIENIDQEKHYTEELIENKEKQEETLQQVDFEDVNHQNIKEEFLPEVKEIEQEIFKLDNEPSTFEFILNDHTEHEKFDFEDKNVNEIFDRPLSPEEERVLAQKRKLIEQPDFVKDVEEEDDEIGPEPFLVQKEESLDIMSEDLELKEAAEPQIPGVDEVVEDPDYKPTLNDVLAGKVNTASVNNTTGKITDLKQAINLNDKLLYIKDLFNGYNLAYTEAIDLANRLPNFEAADNFFKKNYAVKNNWNEKQVTVDKFYQLLNERFK
jgi:hypothetical protein